MGIFKKIKNFKFWRRTPDASIIIFVIAVILEKLYHILLDYPELEESFKEHATLKVAIDFALFLGVLVPFADILHKIYSIYKKNIEIYNQSIKPHTDFVYGAMKQLTETEKCGTLKKINSPRVWDFTGALVGWNPNWYIEHLKTTIGRNLRQTHLKRLVENDVDEITYIFLEDYILDNDSLNQEKFGSKYFIKFLNLLVKENYSQKTDIIDGVKKYNIYRIPKAVWDDNTSEIGKIIGLYKHLLFIGGQKDHSRSLVLFINIKGFLVNDCYEYYLESFNNNKVTEELFNFFDAFTDKLIVSGLVKEEKVSYDNSNKTFEIKVEV